VPSREALESQGHPARCSDKPALRGRQHTSRAAACQAPSMRAIRSEPQGAGSASAKFRRSVRLARSQATSRGPEQICCHRISLQQSRCAQVWNAKKTKPKSGQLSPPPKPRLANNCPSIATRRFHRPIFNLAWKATPQRIGAVTDRVGFSKKLTNAQDAVAMIRHMPMVQPLRH
jgi:hypothetical protein